MTREKKRIVWKNDYTREARAFSKISFPADSTYILENMLFAFPIPAGVVNTGSPNFFDTIITHHYRHIHLFTIFMFTACSLPSSSIHPRYHRWRSSSWPHPRQWLVFRPFWNTLVAIYLRWGANTCDLVAGDTRNLLMARTRSANKRFFCTLVWEKSSFCTRSKKRGCERKRVFCTP